MWGGTGVGEMWGHKKRDTKNVTGGKAWGCMWGYIKGNTGGDTYLRGLQLIDDRCQSRYTLQGTAASVWPTTVHQKWARRAEGRKRVRNNEWQEGTAVHWLLPPVPFITSEGIEYNVQQTQVEWRQGRERKYIWSVDETGKRGGKGFSISLYLTYSPRCISVPKWLIKGLGLQALNFLSQNHFAHDSALHQQYFSILKLRKT